MEIKPGIYQTNTGDEVKIVDVKNDKAIGWFYDGIPLIYNININDSMMYVKYSDPWLNIPLKTWRDEIPWDILKDEIEYVAMDEDNKWNGFESKPEQPFENHNVWDDPDYDNYVYSLESIKMPKPDCNWSETLTKKPLNKNESKIINNNKKE